MAGENLDLKIIIDTLLNAKGFEDAQSGLKTLTDTTNQSIAITRRSTDAGREATRELGGRRGAVADLTRVLLMNAGITGQAGEVAKAAGLGFSTMATGAGLIGAAAMALVASISLLLPELKKWAASADDIHTAQDDLISGLKARFPILQEYISTVHNVSAALQKQYDASVQLLQAQQRLEMAELPEKIKKHQEEYKKLTDSISSSSHIWQRLIGLEDNSAEATRKRAAEAKVLEATIAQEKGRLDEITKAIQQGTVADLDSAAAIKKARKETEDDTKALELRKRALEEQRKLERDLITETGKRQQAENKRKAEARKQREEDRKTAEERIFLLHKEEGAYLDEARIEVGAAKARKAANIELWTSAVQTAVGAFTKNKAINIAAAIADTYAAAAAVLKMYPGPPGWAMAAVQVAEGLAQVQNIRKAEPGFDDPLSDMIATRLGRKSAEDFVKLWGRGFHGGLVDMVGQPAPSNARTIHNNYNHNISVTGVVGSQTEFKRYLTRLLIEGDRAERRSTISG